MPAATRWAALILMGMAAGAASLPAHAASRLCRQLETSLAQAGSATGGTPIARAYDRAIVAQTAAIDKTRARLAAASCSPSFFGLGGCDRLQASLRAMQQNLSSLKSTRAGLGGDGRAERRRLLASLEANGCRDDERGDPAQVPAASESSDEPAGRQSPRSGGQPFCVRTCDGYFFPMTHTSAPVADQAVCEAACPGTEIEVFYRRNGEEAGNMVSGQSGQPYSALRTANLFRDAGKPRPAACGCNAGKTVQAMSHPAGGTAPLTAAGSFVSQTLGTPETGAPETGGAQPAADAMQDAAIRPSLPPPSVEPQDKRQDRHKIRVVGPTFLPAPEAAEAPQAPAPTPAP